MPTYAYRCPKGHEFEAFHKMSEDGPDKCEVCGACPVERVLYPVAVHFKGSGFYSTDYGRGNRKRDASKDGDSSSSSGEGEKSDKSDTGDKSGKGDSSSDGSSGGMSEKKTADA